MSCFGMVKYEVDTLSELQAGVYTNADYKVLAFVRDEARFYYLANVAAVTWVPTSSSRGSQGLRGFPGQGVTAVRLLASGEDRYLQAELVGNPGVYVTVTGSDGNPVNIRGEAGSDGADGTNGTNGTDGINGANGVSVSAFRAVQDGQNVFLEYSLSSDPSTYIRLNTNVKGADGTNGTNGTNGSDGASIVSVRAVASGEERHLQVAFSNAPSTFVTVNDSGGTPIDFRGPAGSGGGGGGTASFLNITETDFTQSDYIYYGGTHPVDSSFRVNRFDRNNLTSYQQATTPWSNRYSATYS